jgi:hypothetical protein
MKRFTIPFIILVLMFAVFGNTPTTVQAYSGYPTTSIASVVEGDSVTLNIYNLPKDIDFRVLIGKFGTLGVGGTKVATFDSEDGGTQVFTFDIPDALADETRLAIRIEATEGVPYFAYDWFNNNSDPDDDDASEGVTPPVSPTAITTRIMKVVEGEDVTIKVMGLPKNIDFKVLIGKFGTLGVGGTQVGTFDSAGGGTQTFTYDIPDALIDEDRLAIRIESTEGTKVFAYDWFWNDSDASNDSASEGPSYTPCTSCYYGYPTFTITAVNEDETVTIKTYNLPKDTDFKVRMGKYGTAALGGTEVETVDSGDGGTLTFTFDIPDGLKGLDRIAIRMDSTSSPYFAYNWFWNNDAP